MKRTRAKEASEGRRRRWRRGWVFLGGVLLGGTLMIALLLAPPVQGWLLKRYIATQPGWRLDFKRLAAGLTGVEASGVNFTMPGVEARAAPLKVEIAPVQLLRNRELRIEKVEAHQVRLVITPAKFAASPPAPATPFTGVLPLLQLPLAWAVDAASLDGQITLNEDGAAVAVGDFQLQGGGLAPGRSGKFAYDISFNSTLLPVAPGNHVRSRGVIRVTPGAGHGVARIELTGDLALPAYGPLRLPAGKLRLTITATPQGETYSAAVDFGAAGRLEFAGGITAGAPRLHGRLEWTWRETLLASLAARPLPGLRASGTAEINLDLGSSDFAVALKGALAGSDWGKLSPELTALPACEGGWHATLTRTRDRFSLDDFALHLRAGAGPPAEIILRQTMSVDPLAPPATPFARIELTHLPLAWASPWLATTGVQLLPAEFNGAWTVSLINGATLVLDAAAPAGIKGLAAAGVALPAADLAFDSRVVLNAKTAAVTLSGLRLGTAQGDALGGELRLNYDIGAARSGLAGELSGRLPTLFGRGSASPELAASLKLTQQGAELGLEKLRVALRVPASTADGFAVTLRQPLQLDLKTLQPASAAPPGTVWATLEFHDLPLGWLDRFTPGWLIRGAMAAGVSVLRADPHGGLELATTTAWRTGGLELAQAGQTFVGSLALAPGAAWHDGTLDLNLAGLDLRGPTGNRLAGGLGLTINPATKAAQVRVALQAGLADLPHLAETSGPLRATLELKAQRGSGHLAIVEAFSVRVNQAADGRELAALTAGAPFIIGLSNSGSFVTATTAPLQLRTGRLPLAWAQPWLGGRRITGTLEPAEFLLAAKNTRYLLRPLGPVGVRDLSLTETGETRLRDTTLSFYPGLDLTLICTTRPKWQLGFDGMVRVDHGEAGIAGRPALDLDLALRLLGNDHQVLPHSVDLTARARLDAWHRLPWLAARGVPAGGQLVVRLNGGLLSEDPVELWARLEQVPARTGAGVVAPLEVSAHGKVSADSKTVAGDVRVTLATRPRTSDVAFQAAVNLRDASLQIASGLHGSYVDAAALLALADAFAPPRREPPEAAAPAPAAVTVAGTVPAARLGMPFWSVLRGRFDLDLGTLVFAPYRIDNLQGRLELGDRSAELSGLRGEMFAGTWSGAARVDYTPADPVGDHRLQGEFAIRQFQSARVVQTVFPDNALASVDAPINVRATIDARGNRLPELLNHAEVRFLVDGSGGTVRLTVPRRDTLATAAVFGGTVLLSPELRALGRLLRKFAAMPVETLRISGMRTRDGEVRLDEFQLESPQARLVGRGRIAAADAPLMQRPLELELDLAAKDETAVILGRMNLLKRRPDAEGYREMKAPLVLRGPAGEPDTRPLYDLLARAVSGSKGTWGFLMRKVQAEVLKAQPKAGP